MTVGEESYESRIHSRAMAMATLWFLDAIRNEIAALVAERESSSQFV